MAKMHDGSEMLAPGTYVRVEQRAIYDVHHREVIFPAHTYVGKVVGTDMGGASTRSARGTAAGAAGCSTTRAAPGPSSVRSPRSARKRRWPGWAGAEP